jgi:hypothetical protein
MPERRTRRWGRRPNRAAPYPRAPRRSGGGSGRSAAVVHARLSFAHDLLGPPTEVIATGTLGATGVDLSVATVLRHAGDRISTTYASMETLSRNTAQVLGSEGRTEIGSEGRIEIGSV